MSGRMRNTAHWLVRRYPKPWRGRYADEVLALIDDSPTRWRDLLDLTRGLTVEHLRSMYEPGARPRLTFAIIVLAPMAAGLVPVLLAAGLGVGAGYVFGVFPGWGELVGHLLPTLAMLVTCVRHQKLLANDPRRYLPPYQPLVTMPAWAAVLSLAGAFVSSWSAGSVRTVNLLMAVLIVGNRLVIGDRCQRMVVAIRQLSSSQRELKWARLELERRERLAFYPTARSAVATEHHLGKLEEARSALRRTEKQQQDALASLDAFGYRARFR